MPASTFPAKFAGKCASCGERIEVGQEITAMTGVGNGFTHVDCDADAQPVMLRSGRVCAHPACGMELPLAETGMFCDDHA